MSGVFAVGIEGTDKLVAKLQKFKKSQSRAAIRKALRAGAKATQKVAKGSLPKKTGKLRRSLKVRAIKRSRKKLGVTVTTGADGSAFKGKAFYGGFQEFGWKTGKRKHRRSGAVPIGGGQFRTHVGGRRMRKQIPAGNHLRKAAEKSEGQASEAVRRVMQQEINRLASK